MKKRFALMLTTAFLLVCFATLNAFAGQTGTAHSDGCHSGELVDIDDALVVKEFHRMFAGVESSHFSHDKCKAVGLECLDLNMYEILGTAYGLRELCFDVDGHDSRSLFVTCCGLPTPVWVTGGHCTVNSVSGGFCTLHWTVTATRCDNCGHTHTVSTRSGPGCGRWFPGP